MIAELTMEENKWIKDDKQTRNEPINQSTHRASNQSSYGNLPSFCLDVAQGCMNWAPNENRTHSCSFASLHC